MKIDEKYERLCLKAIAGGISTAQKVELKSWLDASVANRVFFDDQIWRLSSPPELAGMPSVSGQWHDLELALAINQAAIEPEPAGRRLFAFLPAARFIVAAVAALVVIGIGWFGWAHFSKPEMLLSATQNKERKMTILPDGSTVTLNSESSITYPGRFITDTRKVGLQGEAFFEVVPGNQPFVVMTGNAEVTVLGTSFNLWSRSQETRLVVSEGRVRIAGLGGGDAAVSAGEMSRVLSTQPPLPPVSADVGSVLGWMDGRLAFNKMKLSEIFAELRRHYDVEISAHDSVDVTRTLTGQFDDESLETVLNAICGAAGLRYEAHSGGYLITN